MSCYKGIVAIDKPTFERSGPVLVSLVVPGIHGIEKSACPEGQALTRINGIG